MFSVIQLRGGIRLFPAHAIAKLITYRQEAVANRGFRTSRHEGEENS